MSGEAIENAWESSAETASPFRVQFFRALLLTVGATLGIASYLIAGWLVGLFAPTLPLPPGTRAAAAIVVYSVTVYYLALDTDEDGVTLLDSAIGRVGK